MAELTGGHDVEAWCACVAEHRPPYLELHAHHVWPKEYGGTDDTSPMLWLCPTTHANVHELLRMMLRAGRQLSLHECRQANPRPVSAYAHDVAARGYAHAVAAQR